jgi:hypothetical protein
MPTFKRVLPALGAAIASVLALPAIAPAKLTEVGVIEHTTPETVPSCPGNPCLAVSRTTGFQLEVDTTTAPVKIPREGTIVAWEITLSKPTTSQITFFNEHEGGAASAQLGILAPRTSTSQKHPGATKSSAASSKKHKHSKPEAETEPTEYTLVATSPVVQLEPYFGETAQFPLETTMKVQAGDVGFDRAHVGAGAGAGLWQDDGMAREPAQVRMCGNERADGAPEGGRGQTVCVRVSRSTSDVLRDAHLDPVAAEQGNRRRGAGLRARGLGRGRRRTAPPA